MALRRHLDELVDAARERIRANGGSELALEWRPVAVMLLTAALLTLFYYYGRPSFFARSFEEPLAKALGLEGSGYEGLLSYWYWAVASLVLRVAIPVACIVYWFRETPAEYGFRLWKRGHGRIYLGLYAAMFPVLLAVSFSESFQAKYPFYEKASESVVQFALFQGAYGIQFFALEAFFRGFLVFALFKRFGYYAVPIMTIPYCMIHFAKPMPETLGAIVAGMVLGVMALESRSWLPGALLHWGVALTLDLLVIVHMLR